MKKLNLILAAFTVLLCLVSLTEGQWVIHPKGGVSCGTLCDDLVSYWNLDETSGTRADAVGDNDLTDNNTVGYDTGKNGNAASFVAANTESLTVTAEMPTTYSVSLWANTLATPGVPGNLLALRDGILGQIQYAENDPQGLTYLRFRMYDGDDWEETGAGWSGAQAAKGWSHIVATMDAASKTMTIYLDNVESGTPNNFNGTPGNFAQAHIVKLGMAAAQAQLGDAAGWAPLIDEVAIWSRVLTADERAELYNSGSGKYYDGTEFANLFFQMPWRNASNDNWLLYVPKRPPLGLRALKLKKAS